MGVLYALESIRTPALDKIMSVITLLGGELFFMVIAVTVFWCVSKREGYYLMIVGFFGTVINQFLKILCCVPRPWIKDPDFTIVESARAEATGYSFPSGHTQNAVATYGGIARYTRRGWLRVVLVVLTVLIAFSRMYLGVHTPLDVGVYPIATANDKAQISAPLMSRFAVIDIPDYTQEEKKIIFSKFALPKVLKRIGLLQGEIVLTGEGLDELIEQYKNTSGIRDLEQAAEHLAANALYQIEVNHVSSVTFDAEMVKKLFE